MTVIKHPLATEKGIRSIEADNTIIFVVESKATKKDIKDAVEKAFSAKVTGVNMFNGPDGNKRAYVKFSAQTPAIDIATKLGIM